MADAKDKLSLGALAVDIREYASQGNAVLGIRDSGKSYPSAGAVALTPSGRELAEPSPEPLSTAELHHRVKAKLSPVIWRVLQVAIEHYPDPIERDFIAGRVGQSSTSGAFANYLGRLRSLGLIDYPQPRQVVATPVLFIDGGRNVS
jgi:uncharacterized protein